MGKVALLNISQKIEKVVICFNNFLNGFKDQDSDAGKGIVITLNDGNSIVAELQLSCVDHQIASENRSNNKMMTKPSLT